MIANGRWEYELLMPLRRQQWRQRTDDKRPRLNRTKSDEEGLRKNSKHTNRKERTGRKKNDRKNGRIEHYYRNGTTTYKIEKK